jgi:diguanylate cyclase (GGDEF)-like protein
MEAEESIVNYNGVMEANFALDRNCSIVMGDERFYRLMGNKALYAFNMLVHEDDKSRFEQFINDESTQHEIILRVMAGDDKYNWYCLTKLERTQSDIESGLVNIQLQDILMVDRNFGSYHQKVKKYRVIMNMMHEKIFEYDHTRNIFTVYGYVNNRSEIYEKDDFTEWQRRILRLNFVEDSQIESFVRLCDNVESGAESFSVTMRTSIMSRGERTDLINFRGQTIYEGNVRGLTVGIITELNSKRMQNGLMIENSEANLDSATGILNKKAVTDEVTSAINLANSVGSLKKMYLMIWDIDDFKQVNDTYGHYFGDEVIKSLADELKVTVGSRGFVGRIGGDEFLVFLRDIDDVETLKNILTASRKRLKVLLAQKKEDYTFSASIGISCYPNDARDYETLFKIADGALYIAKEKGKDRYILYDKAKHGELLTDDSSNRKNVAGVDFMRQIDKMDMASRLMIELLDGGRDKVESVLMELIDKMNIHGITIYEGEDMHAALTVGHYENEPEPAGYIFDKAYQKRFQSYNIYAINNIATVAMEFPNVYERFQKNNICSALQILAYQGEQFAALIEFDIFGATRRKWSQDDISTVYIVVKAITDLYKGDYE